SEDFFRDLCEAWQEFGKPALVSAALLHPLEFVRVVASLMPREPEVTVTAVTEGECGGPRRARKAALQSFFGHARSVRVASKPEYDRADLALHIRSGVRRACSASFARRS